MMRNAKSNVGIAGKAAQRNANRHGDQRGQEADAERDPCSEHDPAVQVATVEIGSHPVLAAWKSACRPDKALVVGGSGDQRLGCAAQRQRDDPVIGENGYGGQQHDNRHTHDRQLVLGESARGIAAQAPGLAAEAPLVGVIPVLLCARRRDKQISTI
jgi:hypothetical protein